MGSTLVQFRCDSELKEKTAALYESLGLDLPTAFRLFMKRSLQVQGLPFVVNKASYFHNVSGDMLAQYQQEEFGSKIHSARDVYDNSKEKHDM